MVKELHQLKGAGNPPPGDAVGQASLDLHPAKDDAARLGSQNTVTRLNRVVLPAPLGPMTALTSPRFTPKLTCSTA